MKKIKKKYLIKFQIYKNQMYLTENLHEMNEIIPKIKKQRRCSLIHIQMKLEKKFGKNGFWLTNLYIYI